MKIFSLGLAMACVVGCSSSGSTNDGGTDAPSDVAADSGLSGATACADEANAVCALRDSCSPNYDNEVVYGSTATCVSRVTQSCTNALALSGTGATPTSTEACAKAYPDEACSDFFDDNPVSACVPQVGTLQNGATCGASGQCASTYCAVTSTTVCGTCQPLPVTGAACQVEADCGRDLACATPTVAQGDGGIPAPKCAAFVALNGACLTGYQPCQAGLSCVGDDEATMKQGTCQTSGTTVGAACDGSRKTMPSCYADMGLTCIPTAKGSAVGTCQKTTLAAANAPCGDIGSQPITGFAVCEAGGECVKTSSTATTGTCVAPAADGAACDNDPTKGPPCLSPAKCVVTGTGTAGTCTFPNAVACN